MTGRGGGGDKGGGGKVEHGKFPCPFCGEEFEKLPQHMRKCDEGKK